MSRYSLVESATLDKFQKNFGQIGSAKGMSVTYIIMDSEIDKDDSAKSFWDRRAHSDPLWIAKGALRIRSQAYPVAEFINKVQAYKFLELLNASN